MSKSSSYFAVAIILSLLSGFDLKVLPMPSSDIPQKETSASVITSLKHALATAGGNRDFRDLISILEKENFGIDSTASTAQKMTTADLVAQALSLIKCKAATEESIRCQALIARYFATTGNTDKAIANYNEAIEASKKRWRYVGEPSPTDSILERSCQTALTLLYLKKGDLDAAEKQYKEVNWPWQDLTGKEKEKMFHNNMSRTANRTAQAVLASQLGHAYQAKGRDKEALCKFEDMLAFETFALNPGFRDPYSSISPIIKWHAEPSFSTFSSRPDFDPLVGKYPPLDEIVMPYIKFGKSHPAIVRKEDVARVENQLKTLASLRKAHTEMDKNFDWQVDEQKFLGVLRIEPDKGLALLKQEIEERKKANKADPILVASINLIGFQLIEVGLFTDAEKFINEAIELREKQGPAGRYALGNSISNLGLLYLEEGRLSESKSLLNKALKLRQGDPNDEFAFAKTQVTYGRLLSALGNRTEAEIQLKQAESTLKSNKQESPNFSASDFGINADPLPVLAERKAARMLEQRMGSLFHAKALIELSTLYLDEKKFGLAKQLITQAFAAFPQGEDPSLDARINEKMGRIDIATGKFCDAEKELSKAERAIKEHRACGMVAVDILSALGDLNSKQKNMSKAREYYRQAADRLEAMLGARNARVINMRNMANF